MDRNTRGARRHRVVLLTVVLSVAAALAVTPAHADPPAAGAGLTWDKTFGDEFAGFVLDPLKWGTCYWWAKAGGCTNSGNQELQWYSSGNVSVADGRLALRAERKTVVGPDGRIYPYTSGLVSTGRSSGLLSSPPRYDFRYGYAEARAWVPRGKGLWSAFWMLPSSHEWPPEIDVMEILGDKPATVYMNVQYRTLTGAPAGDGASWTGPDFNAGWHTFGVDWRPEAMVWYVDGVARHTTTDPAHIPDERMYLLANLAVGGKWPGSPDAATPFPSELRLDYVRVWQRRPITGGGTTVATADATAPLVRLGRPALRRGGAFTISARATDAVGVARVSFFDGSRLLCTDTSAPFRCRSKPAPKRRSMKLVARAYDAAGNAGTSRLLHVALRR